MLPLPDDVIAELAPRFGTRPGGLTFLGGGQEWSDGKLYTFATPGDTRVLKLLCFPEAESTGLDRTAERIRLFRYFGERGCRVVLPEPSVRGELLESCSREGFVWVGYSYRMAPGRVAGPKDLSVITGAYYRAAGEVLGGLHAAWAERREQARPDGSSPGSAALRGWRDEWAGFRSWCKDDAVGGAWERLRGVLELLPVDTGGYGFVHNDAHVWNMLLDPESDAARRGEEPELTVIDFDCASYHWFISDAAVAIYSFLMLSMGRTEGPEPPAWFGPRVLEPFWEGYRRRREPGGAWVERLDLFLQYRRILMFTVFQTETEKKPEWRTAWRNRILDEDARLLGRG